MGTKVVVVVVNVHEAGRTEEEGGRAEEEGEEE